MHLALDRLKRQHIRDHAGMPAVRWQAPNANSFASNRQARTTNPNCLQAVSFQPPIANEQRTTSSRESTTPTVKLPTTKCFLHKPNTSQRRATGIAIMMKCEGCEACVTHASRYTGNTGPWNVCELSIGPTKNDSLGYIHAPWKRNVGIPPFNVMHDYANFRQ